MKMKTLSHQLFIRIAPTILITILVIGAFAFHSASKEINTVYDAQLISNANVLWDLLTDELREAERKGPQKINDIDLPTDNPHSIQDDADEYAGSRMFRVWNTHGILVYSDTALPMTVGRQPLGFSTVWYNGYYWRIYDLPVPDKNMWIEVAERIFLRDKLVNNILLNLAIPLILLIPIVGVLIWFGIYKGLDTMRSLSHQILSRSSNNLSPIYIEPLPRDVAALGNSVNQLLIKLQQSFTAEKRFTDHAAHQLRTPLATLKLQLQMLAQTSQEEERTALLNELMESTERAVKLVSQLLTSARLNYEPVTLYPLLLYPVIASVMAESGTLATQKHIEMSLEGIENASVLADETLLKTMFSNIIENALKYTQANGQVKVSIKQQNKAWKISVSDNGPGIPEAEQALVFKRFYRVNSSQVEGSGLGLSIVAEILQLLSGHIALKAPAHGNGLLVEILLPASE